MIISVKLNLAVMNMNEKELMIEADRLLQKWELYSTANRAYIEGIFNGSNRYDMMLNIDIMCRQAVIYMVERGTKIYEYRTESRDVVIYAVLWDIIESISYKYMSNSNADEKGKVHYIENFQKDRKQIVDEAFSIMGEPYNEWNKKGITIWNFNSNF